MKGALLRLLLRVRHWPPVAERLDYEARWRRRVVRRHGLRQGLPTLELLELLPELSETVAPYSFLEGSAGPLELAVLRALARRYEGCRYLEIGTFRGESVANVAPVARRSVTISLPDDEMAACGYSRELIEVHRFFSGHLGDVEHVAANSLTFDFASLGGVFDLVFVDGDHAPDSVRSDTANVFRLLADERSCVVWHDYGFTTDQVRWSVLAGLLDGCPQWARPHLYHLSNTCSAIYTRGSFSNVFVAYPARPNKSFAVSVSVQPG